MPNQQPTHQWHIGQFIAGQWQKSDRVFPVHSPLNGKEIGRITQSGRDELDQAVQFAQAAQKKWSQTPIKERSQIMFKFRHILMEKLAEIAQLISLENGKTQSEAKAELLKGIEVLEFALSLQNSDKGGRLEVSRGVACEYRREALGVVAGITPFNFPAMVPMWMIPIALTLGNAFILKPSEKTPLTSFHLAQSLSEAGIPPGVFSVVHGGQDIVENILEHPAIQAIGFVGSTPVAQKVYQKSAGHNKRVLALGGAKNHIFLTPDASVDITCKNIRDSFTGCAGQRCMAASVLLAIGDCQTLIDEIVTETKKIQLGSDMGAIISKDQVEFLHRSISKAQDEGATLLLDGRKSRPPMDYENGNWIGPTILDGLKPDSEAAQRELFGPILSIIRCQNISQALQIENNSPYGNAASVFTSSGAISEMIVSNAKSAMVGVNIGVPVPREPFSFGGMNESKFGHGDITGPSSVDFWTHLKKVTTKWSVAIDNNWMS